MSSSSKAKIQIELGRTVTAYAAMTDSGDQQTFSISGGTLWSGYSAGGVDYSPSVRPNGIVTGTNVLSAHASANTVTIAAFTAYSKGTLKTVTATSATFTRATDGGRASITSITMASDGSIAKVKGTEHGSTTTFSETRGAAGGPPLIPVNSVEIGQIRTTASTSAVITSSEIFQIIGSHTERYDYPTWTENNIGDGEYATEAAKKNAYVEFDSALPKVHTGTVPKAVFIQYYTPTLTDIQRAIDFVPAENAPSLSSEEYYNGTIGSVSRSLSAGSFSILADNAISDSIMQVKDTVTTVKFFPDRNKAPYILTQGELGVTRSFPTSAQNRINVTIAAENPSASFTS